MLFLKRPLQRTEHPVFKHATCYLTKLSQKSGKIPVSGVTLRETSPSKFWELCYSGFPFSVFSCSLPWLPQTYTTLVTHREALHGSNSLRVCIHWFQEHTVLQEAAAHVQQNQLNLTLKREQREQDAMRAGAALVVMGGVALEGLRAEQRCQLRNH